MRASHSRRPLFRCSRFLVEGSVAKFVIKVTRLANNTDIIEAIIVTCDFKSGGLRSDFAKAKKVFSFEKNVEQL